VSLWFRCGRQAGFRKRRRVRPQEEGANEVVLGVVLKSGKGFHLEIAGADGYVVHAPARVEDWQIILHVMPKH